MLLIVGDAFALLADRAHADWRTLRRLVPTVIVGVLLGTLFLAVADDGWVRRVIAMILAVAIGVTLLRRASVARAERAAVRASLAGTPAVGGATQGRGTPEEATAEPGPGSAVGRRLFLTRAGDVRPERCGAQ